MIAPMWLKVLSVVLLFGGFAQYVVVAIAVPVLVRDKGMSQGLAYRYWVGSAAFFGVCVGLRLAIALSPFQYVHLLRIPFMGGVWALVGHLLWKLVL